MCGIVGYVLNSLVADDTVCKMAREIYHRGPDEEGYIRSGRYVGGMRRLSINDLASGGQPLYNHDKTVAVLYNGEIYNYLELKVFLEERGFVFNTRSDGEVICHLFDLYGEGAFDMLEGMFAISLWDEKNHKLYLVRDYIGEKPLYYSILSSNEIVYSSEVKSFKHFSPLKLELNKQAIWDFLSFLWIPEPETIYENVYALMPGCLIVVDVSKIEIKKYTKTSFDEQKRDHKELVDKTKELVVRAVESRLISDVEVGCFLSGGIDSSIIAAVASKILSNLRTYTIGFERSSDPYGGEHDESGYAADFAARLDTKHTTIHVTAKDFRDILEEVVYFADQPFGISSGLGVFLIAKKAREDGIKVLLSGDGADEMFGGYSWYKYLNSFEETQNISNDRIMEDFSFHNSYIDAKNKLELFAKFSPQKRAWAWHYYASEHDKSILFSDNLKNSAKTSLRYFYEFSAEKSWKAVDFIKQDRMFYLPNEMLKKADRMGMGASVEVRVPFVSKDIINFVGSLDYEDLVYNGELKSLLKEAFKDLLPADIINRPKHGFNVPIDIWLKNEWSDMVEDAFGEQSCLKKLDIVSPRIAPNDIRTMLDDKTRIHGHTIFCLIMLNMWLKKEMRI
jgi:asparagine synthase (glutamine-hydrolysing)